MLYSMPCTQINTHANILVCITTKYNKLQMDTDPGLKVEIDYKQKDAPTQRIVLSAKDFLETPADEILNLLYTSSAPNEKWLEVAFIYLKLHRDNEFQRVIYACIDANGRKGGERRSALVYLFNVLAAYFMSGYMSERDLAKKEELRTRVFTEINNSDGCSRDEPMTSVKKGFVMLAEDSLTLAKEYFDYAIEINSKQVTALFGKGCLAYNQGSYTEALKIFQHIFTLDPSTPLNVRQCIGLCFYKLGDYKKARQAFMRCLQLDPDNDSCLVYLGIMAMREGPEYISQALEWFQQAYRLNPNNPLCLLQLANHYFLSGDFGRSETLAKKALTILECYKLAKSVQKIGQADKKEKAVVSDIHAMRADLYFLLGKIAHSKEVYRQALKLYKDALEENPQHYPANFYAAQVLIQMKQFSDAEAKLKVLRDQYKTDPELTKLLAYCQMKLSKRKEAIDKYEQVASLLVNDLETLVELAQLLEVENPAKALDYYTRAVELLKKQDSNSDLLKARAELFNNIGVAKTLIGNYASAKEDLKAALSLLSEEHKKSPTIRTIALRITLRFNLAYLYEMQGAFAEATGFYKQIINEHPDHVDSYMRLSILAMRRGNYPRSIDYAESAVKHMPDKKSHACTCFLGSIYAQLKETNKALGIFNSVSAATAKHDTYALIGGASMVLAHAHQKDPPNELLVKNALQDFVLAIEHEERNAYAAVGVANCLALLGKSMDAIQIYKVIKETSKDVHPAMINLARAYMMEGKRVDAIPIYKKYIEKYAKKEEMIEMELAAAYYQEQMYDEAIFVLKKLQNRFPFNPIIKYNAALCLEQQVKIILSKKIRKVTETQEAIRKTKLAASFFDDVKRVDQTAACILMGNRVQTEIREEMIKGLRQVVKKADEHLFYCEDILKTSKSYLEHDQKVERELAELRMEQERKRLEKEKTEKKKTSIRVVTEEEEQEIARRIAELNAELIAGRQQKAEKKKRGKGKAKKEEPEEVQMEPQSEGEKEIENVLNEESDFMDEEEEPEAEKEYDPTEAKIEVPQTVAPEASAPLIVKKKRLHKEVQEVPLEAVTEEKKKNIDEQQ
eukprot:TRINITY_DN70845_c3_g1_i1.p2 TRINITY_DN70845_c3_g1~~TRINITY_DN70845_c3_g1_i1.p2  ORF type:complete len:1075 (-),score=192.01 TRINITY_DN70845_c3_g1_i1:80-3304(-)